MKALLRWINRRFFALSGVALLLGLLILGVHLWDKAFPGIVGYVDGMFNRLGRVGGLSAIIFVPLPLFGLWLWYMLFSWIDRKLLDEGELAEAKMAARDFFLTGEDCGVCIYRKRSRHADTRIPLVVGKRTLADFDPRKPVLQAAPAGKLAIGAGAPAPGHLLLRVKPGTLYFICHEVSRGSLAGDLGSKVSHFHLTARQVRT